MILLILSAVLQLTTVYIQPSSSCYPCSYSGTNLNSPCSSNNLANNYYGSNLISSPIFGGSGYGFSNLGGQLFGGSGYGSSNFGGLMFGGSGYGSSNFGGQMFGGNGYGSSNFGCQSIRTSGRTLRDWVQIQPLYLTFAGDTKQASQNADSVCYTYFQLPDGSDTWLEYQSSVFLDGSTQVTTFIAQDDSPGQFTEGSQDIIRENYDLGSYSCSIIGYSITDCGDCDFYSYGVTPQYGSTISQSDFGSIQQITQSAGLPVSSSGSLYYLPMRQQPQCVFQNSCPSVASNPLAQYFYPSSNSGFYPGSNSGSCFALGQ